MADKRSDLAFAAFFGSGKSNGGGGGGGGSVTVDAALSSTSENPVQNKVINAALATKGTYSKPASGIPKSDLANDVRTSLEKADNALPSETDTDVSGGGTFSPVNMSDGLETYDGETWRWSGESATASGWWRTNKIAVMPGYTYRFINFPKNAYLYPASGGGTGSESVEMGTGNDFTYTIPDDVYFLGCYVQGTAKTGLQMYRMTPTPEEEAMLSETLMSPPFSLALENLRRDSVVNVLSPLKGKKIVNFGDSIFGNVSAPEDVSTFLSLYTGATAYNCAFGGTMMTTHSNSNYALFSFHALVDAIVSGDWSAQDAAIADSEWTKPEAFAPHLATLKALDFSKVDIITIAYGTNDWNSAHAIDNAQSQKDLTAYCGAFRYSIEKLLTAYPHLRVFACTPIFRTQLDENTHEPIQYSDTWQNSDGKTLPDFCAALRNVSAEYGIKCIDNYYELGFNKLNRTLYYRENDGTHPSVEGRKRIARNVADGITSVGVGWPVGSSADLTGYATQAWVGQQGYLTLSTLPVYDGGVS